MIFGMNVLFRFFYLLFLMWWRCCLWCIICIMMLFVVISVVCVLVLSLMFGFCLNLISVRLVLNMLLFRWIVLLCLCSYFCGRVVLCMSCVDEWLGMNRLFWNVFFGLILSLLKWFCSGGMSCVNCIRLCVNNVILVFCGIMSLFMNFVMLIIVLVCGWCFWL